MSFLSAKSHLTKRRITEKPKGYSDVYEIAKELGVSYSHAARIARTMVSDGLAESVFYVSRNAGGSTSRCRVYRIKK